MTMDYEKKYKEALNRAKKLKENPKAMFFEEKNMPISDYIFPELAESNDERIRKELIEHFRWNAQILNDFNNKDVIAWLEKQGEQKPQRMISAEAKEALYNKPTCSDPDALIEESYQQQSDDLIDTVTEKPKWSEEDEEVVNNIIDYMMPMPIFFESTKGKSGKEYTKEFVKEAIKWLKSIKERLKGE